MKYKETRRGKQAQTYKNIDNRTRIRNYLYAIFESTDNGECWCSQAKLAKYLKLRKATVGNYLRELYIMDEIWREEISNGNRKNARYIYTGNAKWQIQKMVECFGYKSEDEDLDEYCQSAVNQIRWEETRHHEEQRKLEQAK